MINIYFNKSIEIKRKYLILDYRINEWEVERELQERGVSIQHHVLFSSKTSKYFIAVWLSLPEEIKVKSLSHQMVANLIFRIIEKEWIKEFIKKNYAHEIPVLYLFRWGGKQELPDEANYKLINCTLPFNQF